MAHFAEIIDGIVARVIVINNADMMVDEERNEAKGAALCNSLLGGTWVQTSYNTHGGVNSEGRIALRFNYAGIGYTYDTVLDAFYTPKPYPSWILDETTCQWEAPVPMPVPNNPPQYDWDEATLSWVEQSSIA